MYAQSSYSVVISIYLLFASCNLKYIYIQAPRKSSHSYKVSRSVLVQLVS